MLEVFPAACTCDQFHFYFAFRFCFSSSDLAHRAPVICNAVVVRLFVPDRDPCGLASCCDLPLVLLQLSNKQFYLRTRIIAAYFSSYTFFSDIFLRSYRWILWTNKLYFYPSAGRFIKKSRSVSCEYDRVNGSNEWVVQTQLRKLRGTPDTFVGRAYSTFHLKHGVCELNLRHGCNYSVSQFYGTSND